MFVIDRIALTSPVARAHPAEKLFPSLGGLCLALSAPDTLRASGLLAVYVAVGLLYSGARPRIYLSILMGPAAFIAAGSFGLALGVALEAPSGAPALPIGSLFLYWSAAAAERALLLGTRAFAASAALLALVTTTPLSDLLRLCRRCGLPAFLVELAALVYRYIAVLWESAERIRVAQTCRRGYDLPSRSLRSLGLLGAATFRSAWDTVDASWIALRSRGYDGILAVRYRDRNISGKSLLGSAAVLIALSLFCYMRIPA